MSQSIRYELHITRAPNWSESLGHEIPAAEWMALVAGDPDLVADPSNGDHAALWSHPDHGGGTWFDWCNGNVYTANPDRPVLEKVLHIAQLLGARVVGDDGTQFDRPSQALPMWDLR